MKVLSPFGPKIAIIKIPKNIIKKINLEVDKILNDKKKLKKSDYSLLVSSFPLFFGLVVVVGKV